ncbi:prepilin-type N-terminal cleavage/methylation domain-containing protein [Agaribacterium sp. ZY112]|uniref:prepilin-type N-terminal cleavage/methylation domain-containing protein n=1 Tax=Agaribacterium sp. ZY112 TaxID=3233574 RepID=UPI003525EBF4
MREPRCQSSSGFTLLEIMAVVLILGLMATGAVVIFSSGGPKKDFYGEIEKFTAISHQVSDFAIVTGEPMGLVLTPPLWSSQSMEDPKWSYTWKRFVEAPVSGGASQPNWEDLEGFEPVVMHKDIELQVYLDADLWEWQDTPPSDLPIFIISPSGEAEPFEFEIEFAHRQDLFEAQHIEFHKSGRLQWREAWEDKQALKEQFE